jgi:chromosome segregation ATPase
MFSTSEHSHPTFPSVKSPTRNNVASVSSKSPIRDSNIPSIDVSNPWKEDNLKDNRVTKLLEKSKVTSIVSKSPSSRKEIAPPISPPQKSDDLVVSPGDDDSFAMSFKDSKCPAEISSKKSLTKFSYELVVLASKVESRNLSLKVSFRIWKMSSQLLQSKQVNSDLTEQLHSREKARLQSNAEYDKRVESLERKLHDEETRNSALQDRLITMEQDNVARVNEHMAKQEALSTQLEVQKEMLKDAQDNLSQHEKKYSQSLQDITSDVVQFTKVMESKDDNIASLLSTKDKMENEIHELRAENKDLVSSRENFVCPDCTKMKTFFDTMQHDMQHLMEKKVQLEHENAQIPVLTDQLASLREKLTVTQLDFTKQVSEMQQKSQGMVAQSVVVELENKYTEQLREKEADFVAKEKMLQDCLREVASAKDALMEYDDKCMEMEDLLKKSQAQ